jgi:hypothetical protein
MAAVYIQGVIRPLGIVTVLVGCGRFGFDPGPADAAADAVAPLDSIDALPPSGPFGPAVPLSINTASVEDDPSLTGDGLELYFNSNRAGGMGGNDIWVATRARIDDPWDVPRAIVELNTTGDDATPDVSRDGLTLYWAAPGAAGVKDLWFATRPDRASPWGTRQRIVELASAADEAGPTLTPDGLTFYFARDPSGTDDIYVSTRASTPAAWGAPVQLTELGGAGVLDSEPFVNGSNTLLLFYSARSGNNDLWFSRRASPALPWDPPAPLAELNTMANAEADPWLSPDEHVIYFARNNDILRATR